MTHPALRHLAHRPWALPARPWVWRQTWHNLLFLHWPVPAGALRPLVPSALEIQEFDGSAWVGVIPFWMSRIARRPFPPVPGSSTFPELNVRTYVTLADRPGVWFFSLDAANRLAVWVARRLFHLNYVHARMTVRREGECVHYHSAREGGTIFDATYEPAGPVATAAPGTLAHWVTERYCLYALAAWGRLYRAEIHHARWPLQPVRATMRRNDLLAVHGIAVDGPPAHARYAARLEVVVWPVTPVDTD